MRIRASLEIERQKPPTAGCDNQAHIEAVMGASGSGKSHYVKSQVKRLKPKRLVIWDAREEYGELATPTSRLADVLAGLRSGKRVKLAYRPKTMDEKALKEKFAALCQLVFAAGDVLFIAEELSDVTSPSHAPGAWRQISTQGRHRGLMVYGTSQRPASIDKHFLGNATHVRTHRLNYQPDRINLAQFLDLPLADITALTGYSWIARDMREGVITKG
ncbi:hypothetical protein C8E02_0928 [Vogesella indigofera]|uniref:Uncharacterized protein n=1 Tax=Vogesella indigofera TaxID=45465 RepID=A0A495BJT6_VOGIN|nr:hypothetical protein [Vogesella indigofera]RKQ61161.1 hypothetical protein C8E02_0928 [Vogesella indigofera]